MHLLFKTCLVECIKQQSFSFIKVPHMHAANSLSIQDQPCHWILLREILKDEICFLYLGTTLIKQNRA